MQGDTSFGGLIVTFFNIFIKIETCFFSDLEYCNSLRMYNTHSEEQKRLSNELEKKKDGGLISGPSTSG